MSFKLCDWCVPKPHLGFIADKNGFFSDFDCDLSYGIGVCGGCGGLGMQVAGEDFDARTARIMKLRFEYCPTNDVLPPLPIGARLRALKGLKNELAEHYRLYGEGRSCYAKFLLETELDRLIKQHTEFVESDVEVYKRMPPNPGLPNHELAREAIIASIRGDLEEAEQKYRAHTEQTNNSIAWHDLGTFLLMYRRDANQALECYRTSCLQEPKKSLHFIQTAHLLMLLDRNDEVLSFLRQSTKCADFESQEQNLRQQIIDIIAV